MGDSGIGSGAGPESSWAHPDTEPSGSAPPEPDAIRPAQPAQPDPADRESRPPRELEPPREPKPRPGGLLADRPPPGLSPYPPPAAARRPAPPVWAAPRGPVGPGTTAQFPASGATAQFPAARAAAPFPAAGYRGSAGWPPPGATGPGEQPMRMPSGLFPSGPPRPIFREPFPIRGGAVALGVVGGGLWMMLFGLLASGARGYAWISLFSAAVAWGVALVLARMGDRGAAVGVAMSTAVGVAIVTIVIAVRWAGGTWLLW